ncbi:MAG TPA: vWA domain-containing protein [Solimonas sp.]|nr:vWA domain-containing protein [Solimonas sp.]
MAQAGKSGPAALILALVCIFLVALAISMISQQPASDSTDLAQLESGGEQDPQGGDPAAPPPWPMLQEGAAAPTAPQLLAASNYYVVLDGSGSMQGAECAAGSQKINAAKRALERFVKAVPQAANLGLLVFDGDGISERVPLGSGNREAFVSALKRVQADGGTPLRSSIEKAYERLTEQGRAQLGYGDYHLVVVTDGDPQPADEDPTPVVNRLLAESPVVLHTIGFCIGTDHVLNQPGRSYYVAADSPQQLAEGLGEVLAEAPDFDVTQFQQQ